MTELTSPKIGHLLNSAQHILIAIQPDEHECAIADRWCTYLDDPEHGRDRVRNYQACIAEARAYLQTAHQYLQEWQTLIANLPPVEEEEND